MVIFRKLDTARGAVGNHADKLQHAPGNTAAGSSLPLPFPSCFLYCSLSYYLNCSLFCFLNYSLFCFLYWLLLLLPLLLPPTSSTPAPSSPQPGHNINSTDLCSQMRAGLVAATARLAGNPKVKPTKQRTHLFIMIIRQGAGGGKGGGGRHEATAQRWSRHWQSALLDVCSGAGHKNLKLMTHFTWRFSPRAL